MGNMVKQSRFPLSIPRIPNIGTQLDMEIWDAARFGEQESLLFVRFTGYSSNTPRSIDRGPSSTRLWGHEGRRKGTPLSDLQATGVVVGMDRDTAPAWSALPSGNGVEGWGACYTASLGVPSLDELCNGSQKDTHWHSPRLRAPIPHNHLPGHWATTRQKPSSPGLINPPTYPPPSCPIEDPPSPRPPGLSSQATAHTPFNTKQVDNQHRHHHHPNTPPPISSHDAQHKGPPSVPQGRDVRTYLQSLSSGGGACLAATYPRQALFSRKI
ncbi:hypothetical protein B0T18DRAFT_410558 [Schizothecium vesticola]|uniref:Uncharacterized protein n=1 Tax=Schizothecium vesticola TaxID=314040 RepID=A0AA40EV51_9PEZI|nr:hypothetical protein B0T18DRAFT_410558 [Schizothecium vesticola]